MRNNDGRILSPNFPWSAREMPAEDAVEITLVGESYRVRDLGDRKTSTLEKLLRALEPQPREV